MQRYTTFEAKILFLNILCVIKVLYSKLFFDLKKKFDIELILLISILRLFVFEIFSQFLFILILIF